MGNELQPIQPTKIVPRQKKRYGECERCGNDISSSFEAKVILNGLSATLCNDCFNEFVEIDRVSRPRKEMNELAAMADYHRAAVVGGKPIDEEMILREIRSLERVQGELHELALYWLTQPVIASTKVIETQGGS